MDKFWLVWGIGKGVPTVQHPSFALASQEADRLAAKHPGVKFVVMESMVFHEGKVVVEKIHTPCSWIPKHGS